MLKKTKESDIALLDRKRIVYEFSHSGASTPSRKSLKEEIAKSLAIDPNLIAIRHIFGRFGSNSSKVIVHVYKDEKMLKYLEPKKGKKEVAKASWGLNNE